MRINALVHHGLGPILVVVKLPILPGKFEARLP
jgi:hypothetical protein